MRYFIDYIFYNDLTNNEVQNSKFEKSIFFRDKEDYINTFFVFYLSERKKIVKILDFGECYGWKNNEH